MEIHFPESDWKLFRQLRELALERFYQRAMDEICQCASDEDKSCHERYLAVNRLVRDRDERWEEVFNNPRRSSVRIQLARIRMDGLLTDEEFARFSDECRASVQIFVDLWQAE
jgi:hypothetical protein